MKTLRGFSRYALFGCLLLLANGCGSAPPDPDEAKATTTPSGLKIYDVKEGTGREAKVGDVLTVHYTGTLREGRTFDSTRKLNKPVRVIIGEKQVIGGWDEGLIGMKAGGERKLFIPPSLGYGPKGMGNQIPPDSDLIFDIDLIAVEPALVIEDLKVGEGPAVKQGDRVEVHYTGWLTNGQEFDSSVPRGKPFTFGVGFGEVIRGWDRGLVGMKTGGKRKLTIAPELAYGETPKGNIPPLSTLVFEVELLSIKK